MRLAAPALLLATLAVGGCRSLTEPDTVDVRFSSSIDVAPATDPQVEAITATATTGAIVVVGALRTPSACFELTPRVRRDGSAIIVIIVARETTSGCGDGTALYEYSLRMGRLPPGDYHLTLSYAVVGASLESTAWTPIDATLHVL